MSNLASIKSATPSDACAILALIRAAYAMYVERIGKEPAPMQSDMPVLIAQGGVYVLRVGAALRGSVRLTPIGKALEVNDLVVDPSFQGRGLGRMLMNFAEDTARAGGLSALTLYTNQKMVENLVLYRRLGFQEVGWRREKGFDRVYFRRDLYTSSQ